MSPKIFKSRTPFKTAAVITSAVLFLTACSSDSDGGDTGTANGDYPEDFAALVEEASAQDSVTIYHMLDESAFREIADDFTDRFGISVNPVRLVTGDLQQRYSSEASQGSAVADLVMVTHSAEFMQDGYDSNWFRTADELELPESISEFPDDFYADEGNTPIILMVPGYGIWNSSSDVERPSEWTDFADPKYEGNLIISDPGTSPAGLAFWQLQRDVHGDEFLEDVAANNPIVHNSASPVTQAVAAGEGAIGYPGVPAIVNTLIDQGAPLEMVELSPTTGNEVGLAVSENSPNSAGGALFMAYLMDEAGSISLAETAGGISPYETDWNDRFTRFQDITPWDSTEIRTLLGIE